MALFMLVSYVAVASDFITIQNIPYYNPKYIGGNGAFTDGYSIIINGYMFEEAHVLCYKWTKDYYCNDEKWIKEHGK